MTYHGFIAVQGRGVVALPVELRRRLGLETAGAQMEVTERDDGVIELRPAVAVPADQAWFWSERWQRREREVDELAADGQVTSYASADEFDAALEALSGDVGGSTAQ